MPAHPNTGHPKNKNQNFLKRNRRGFLYVVSLFLLLSLSVREQIRDKAKEEADTVATARNMFYLRIDTLRASDEIIKNIEVEDDASRGRAIPPDQLEAKVKEQLKVDFRASIASLHMADALSRLASVLELSEKEKSTLDQIQQRNIKRGDTFENVGKSLEKHTLTQTDYETAKSIANEASALDWDILSFGTRLSDQADTEVAKQEERYQWTSRVSYFLGLCLWYFAFLGKQYDVDLPEGE
ncbi:MAG: hypothetical protein LAO56_02960 [Acidobacteriia bacterium]|nr:hypothetical protein [Terriglobia bacterium]